MTLELFDELSLRPLRRSDVGALTALGYGTEDETTAMVESALEAARRGDANPMVIIRRCLAPDPRSFNGLRTTPLIVGLLSDIGDVWLASDSSADLATA